VVVCVDQCVYVCKRESERARDSLWVCATVHKCVCESVWIRKSAKIRGCVCRFGCQTERERERETVYGCVLHCVSVCARVCVDEKQGDNTWLCVSISVCMCERARERARHSFWMHATV